MGSMAEKWAKANITRAGQHAMIDPGHKLVLSGPITWCHDCGSYADAKAVGLTQQCKGIPKWDVSYGGPWGQRRKFLAGIHPKTKQPIDAAVGLDGKTLEQVLRGEGTYTNTASARRDRAERIHTNDTLQPISPKWLQPQGGNAKENFAQTRLRIIRK